MKHLLILGAGTAGTMMANKLRPQLDDEEWEMTIIDKEKTHYYQAFCSSRSACTSPRT